MIQKIRDWLSPKKEPLEIFNQEKRQAFVALHLTVDDRKAFLQTVYSLEEGETQESVIEDLNGGDFGNMQGELKMVALQLGIEESAEIEFVRAEPGDEDCIISMQPNWRDTLNYQPEN